jgi:type VI secretion system secreted protein VgrG
MDTQNIIGAITGGLSQQDRLLKLDTPAGNNVLLPHRAIGCSRIGRDFTWTIDVVSTSGDVQLMTLPANFVSANRAFIMPLAFSVRRASFVQIASD